MNLKDNVEWLLSFEQHDEPLGILTHADRRELEQRRAMQEAQIAVPNPQIETANERKTATSQEEKITHPHEEGK
jgi:hypothetical protein